MKNPSIPTAFRPSFPGIHRIATVCALALATAGLLPTLHAARLFEVQEGIPRTVETVNSEGLTVVVPEQMDHLGGLVWSWSEEDNQPNFGLHAFYLSPPGQRTFQRRIDSGRSTPAAAHLIVAAAGKIDVVVNGRTIAEGLQADTVHTVDVHAALRRGANDFAIVVDNLAQPRVPTRAGERTRAGLIGRIVLDHGRDQADIFPLDSSWQVLRGEVADWGQRALSQLDWQRAAVVGPYGIEPWGQISGPLIPPPTFPRFTAGDLEREMELYRDIALRFFRYGAVPTYKDIWMAESYLWIGLTDLDEYKRNDVLWKEALLNTHRYIDEEGYVATDQHVGLGHPRGWPFPTWFQARGAGWTFSHTGNFFLESGHIPHADPALWTLNGLEVKGRGDPHGLELRVTDANAWLQTPPLNTFYRLSPFFTVEWNPSKAGAAIEPYLEWSTANDPEFGPERRVPLSYNRGHRGTQRSLARLFDHPRYGEGPITGFRIHLGNSEAVGDISVKLVFTTQDTRHNGNNAQFIGGVHDVFAYTGDSDWLRAQMPRLRKALNFALNEFQIRELKHVRNPWVGHEGWGGIEYVNGEKVIHRDRGMGNNYWDLLPFGGNDFYASMLYFVALQRMANLEALVQSHPDWGLANTDDAFDPEDLRALAQAMKVHANEFFWNEATGRFPANIDFDGVKNDFGFTFVNLEAIYYGFANEDNARAIMEWITGERIVEGDTSQGDDIYRWRFAPRATTKRNIEWYKFAWSAPERLNFGDQVQDGGAVFGFSYHDLMARHRTLGPDNAWQRLMEILEWYEEVWEAGGFMPFYEVNEGTLQSPLPGGLGLHREFTETSLMPLYAIKGLFGFAAKPDGFVLDPHFPQAVPEFSVDRVRYQDALLTLRYQNGFTTVEVTQGSLGELQLYLPEGLWEVAYANAQGRIGDSRRVHAKAEGTTVPLQINGSDRLHLRPVERMH